MGPTTAACGHDHLVEFYETEAFLTVTVGGFLAPALRDGDSAVVVATEAHLKAFATGLHEAGVDVRSAIAEGRYLPLDAAELLARFMVGGAPDRSRFREVIGAILDRATAGGRQARIYSEMVALLWSRRDIASTLALEDHWHDLAKVRRFLLMCAYPMRAFDDAASTPAFKQICDQHVTVIPSEGYSLHADPAERARTVAQLQQERAVLQTEVTRLRAAHEAFAGSASVDALTGLGNRRTLDEHLEREWTLTLRDDIESVVLVIALDGFSERDDRRGAALRDTVLREFATVLQGAARRTDITARIGAHVFAVLLLRSDASAARRVMRRLAAALEQRPWLVPAPVRMSSGHASLQDATSSAQALDAAYLAMRAAQRAGAGP